MWLQQLFFKRCCYRVCIALLALFSVSSWAAGESVLTLYVTNSGMISTLGTKGKTDGLLTYEMDTSTEPTLSGDPPNILLNDSPLKFLMTFFKNKDRYGAQVLRWLSEAAHKDQPLHVYVAAAGADAAETITEKKDLPDPVKLKAYVVEGRNDHCFNFGTEAGQIRNKKEFFGCMVKAEVAQYVPAGKVFTLAVEQDVTLMKTIAAQHLEASTPKKAPLAASPEASKQDDVILLHATTYVEPYHMARGREPLPQDKKRLGGPYQTGREFCEDYLETLLKTEADLKEVTDKFNADLALKDAGQHPGPVTIDKEKFETGLKKIKNRDGSKANLVCAIYTSPYLHQVCQRATIDPESGLVYEDSPYMMYRLGVRRSHKALKIEGWPNFAGWPMGCNVFGDLTLKAAMGELPSQEVCKSFTFTSEDLGQVETDAYGLLDKTRDALLDILLTFYHSEFESTWKDLDTLPDSVKLEDVPQVVMVGEKIKAFEVLALRSSYTGLGEYFAAAAEITGDAQGIDGAEPKPGYARNLWDAYNWHKFKVWDFPTFKQWVDTYGVALLTKMKFVPSAEFPASLHAGAQSRLGLAQ